MANVKTTVQERPVTQRHQSLSAQLVMDDQPAQGARRRFKQVTVGGSVGVLTAEPRRPIPPKLYRIGEVVDYSGMSRQTIHNYTTMGLLHESRWTNGGHRLYDESVFGRLDVIAEMKASGQSIDDIKEHFDRLESQ